MKAPLENLTNITMSEEAYTQVGASELFSYSANSNVLNSLNSKTDRERNTCPSLIYSSTLRIVRYLYLLGYFERGA